MPSDPHNDDPFLQKLLEEVLADHSDMSPEALEEMRWILELAAKSHPIASAIVNRARPREAPKKSGEQEKPGADPLEAIDDDRREGTGG